MKSEETAKRPTTSTKATKKNKCITSPMKTNLQLKQKDIVQPHRREFDEFINNEHAVSWVKQETSIRKKIYYAAKHILALLELGMSFSEMVGNFLIPDHQTFELDKALTFFGNSSAKEEKKDWHIRKVIQNENDKDYLQDRYQALIMWEEEKYAKTLYICPLSCLDTRYAILLMFDCQVYKNCLESEVIKNAREYYNDYYRPIIEEEAIITLNKMYKETVGHYKKDNTFIFNCENLCAKYINKHSKFLVFPTTST